MGSLALHEGVLFVGSHAKTAHVAAFDLDGRELSSRFSFRDEDTGRSSVAGLAVDPDRRLWVADRGAGRLRAFNLFGRELSGLTPAPLPPRRGSELRAGDRAGALSELSGVSVLPTSQILGGDAEDPLLLVLSSGTRRHAAQLFRAEDGALIESLRPLGDPQGRFGGARRAASSGRYLWIVEALARRVQVFRGADFHFAFEPRDADGHGLDPVALAAAPGERLLLATGGERASLLLLDASGRILRVLAGAPREGASTPEGGFEPEGVESPVDVALAPGASDRETRVALLDQDGARVQVYNLEGRCYGAFPTLGDASLELEAD